MDTSNNTVFDADFFIAKYMSIPEILWCEGGLKGPMISMGKYAGQHPHCALGHSGVNGDDPAGWALTPESTALVLLLGGDCTVDFKAVYKINDARKSACIGDTPRQRMLRAVMRKSVPLYKHDCDRCIYLGKFNGSDLYFCEKQGNGLETVIARNSNQGGDYSSGLQFGIQFKDDMGCPLGEAYRRTVAAGYIKDSI